MIGLIFFLQDVPPFYEQVLNQVTLAAVLAVIGMVKVIRNVLNVKGALAIIITFAAAILFGVTQYGFTEIGLSYGVLVGVLAALSFYLSKNAGTLIGNLGIGNKEGLSKLKNLYGLIKQNEKILIGIVKVVRYILVRK